MRQLKIHVDKLKEQLHNSELQLQDKNAKLDKYLSNYEKATKQNEELQSQLKVQEKRTNDLKQQNNDFEIQIIKKDSEIGHLKELTTEFKNKIVLYEKELKAYSTKIGILQEKLSVKTTKKDKSSKEKEINKSKKNK